MLDSSTHLVHIILHRKIHSYGILCTTAGKGDEDESKRSGCDVTSLYDRRNIPYEANSAECEHQD